MSLLRGRLLLPHSVRLYDRPTLRLRRPITTASAGEAESQILRLPDNRAIGFAEYGSRIGYPLFYLHGYPSNRLEGRGPHKIAKKLGVRLIAPDRPGYGLSTLRALPTSEEREDYSEAKNWDHSRLVTTENQARGSKYVEIGRKHTMLSYPDDIVDLADHLNIAEFSIMGCSGGGPSALACGLKIPQSRLKSVGLFASGPPWFVLERQTGENGKEEMVKKRMMDHMMWPSWMLYKFVNIVPFQLSVTIINGIIDLLRRIASTGWVEKKIENWLSTLPKSGEDTGSRSVKEQRERFVNLLFEGFRQGSEGAVHETLLLTDDWGFDFKDVKREIKIWHGDKDTNAPIQNIRYLADRLSNGHLKVFEGTNHYRMGEFYEEALLDLIPAEMRKTTPP